MGTGGKLLLRCLLCREEQKQKVSLLTRQAGTQQHEHLFMLGTAEAVFWKGNWEYLLGK